MNEIMNTVTQTPIEIALGIDENGMTTARALYSFLELRPGNFARWCKANIIENQFAEENTDYLRLLFDEETPTGGKIQREDYKLSASFAKKLSMMSKSEKGEQARQYFIKVEDGMKELAIRFRNMSPELRAVLVVDRRVTKIEEKTDGLRQEFEDFKNDMPILGVEEGKITTAIHRKGVECLGWKQSNAYNNKSLRATLYSDMHRQLKREFGVSTYKAIKRNQTDLAVQIIEAYKPPRVIAERIERENAQENLFEENIAI